MYTALQSQKAVHLQANTKHLYNIHTTSAQRLRRWSNIVKMLYKCFAFAVLLKLADVLPFEFAR